MKSDQNTTDELLNPLIPPSTPLIGMQRPNECRQAGLMRRGGGRIRIVNPPSSRALCCQTYSCALSSQRQRKLKKKKKKVLEIFGFVSGLKILGPNLKTASLPLVKLDDYFRAFGETAAEGVKICSDVTDV